MIIHIIGKEGFYQKGVINLIERNFAPDSYRFVFRSRKITRENYRPTTSIDIKDSLISLILFLPQLIKAKKICIHYLPHGPSLIFWAIYSLFSKKLVWIYWGGDIYVYKEKNKNLKSRFYEFFRRILIRNLRNIAGFLYEDFEIIKTVYKTNAKYTKTIYPLPINFNQLEEVSVNHVPHVKGKTCILAGNSPDTSNNHFELFNFLEKFRDENIEIICPLSYGSNSAYIASVIAEGERIFGEKFKPLLQFLPPHEYSKILLDVDVAVMNHERQQGLGNIISILYLGKKVYVRSSTSSFSYFKAENIAVWDTLQIKNQTFENFIAISPDDAIKNKSLVLNVFSEQHYKELWSNVFSLK